MLLAIDVGNSNIKFGLYSGGELRGTWRAVTVPDKMADEYAVLLGDFLGEQALTFASVRAAIMASVVPDTTPTIAEMCERYMRLTPLLVGPGIKTGVRLRVDQPQMVGGDRVVNAAAAHALYGGPAIVLDCGTATKWEVISAQGDYLGGAIGPGIGLLPTALAGYSAHLNRVALKPTEAAIGRSLGDAMQSGLFWGSLGMIEGLIARIRQEMRAPDAKVIATGGLAALFAQHTRRIDVLAPTLTLDGLRIIWELNQPVSTSAVQPLT